MPFYSASHTVLPCAEVFKNRCILFLDRSISPILNPITNLIIDCDLGVILPRTLNQPKFRVPAGLTFFFYCPHGMVLEPRMSPTHFMQEPLEAYEDIGANGFCDNYVLMPKAPFSNIDREYNRTRDAETLNRYKSAIKTERTRRLNDGDRGYENLYDILTPASYVSLAQIAFAINNTYINYRKFYCLFGRSISNKNQGSFDFRTIPKRQTGFVPDYGSDVHDFERSHLLFVEMNRYGSTD